MIDYLLKYSMENKTEITIMYKKGLEISQRNIKVLKISKDTVYSYCYTRKATRNFKIENILAAMDKHINSNYLGEMINC